MTRTLSVLTEVQLLEWEMEGRCDLSGSVPCADLMEANLELTVANSFS